MGTDKPLPELDPVNEEFFRGLSEKRLLIQKCSKCGNLQFYPKPMCVKCSSMDLGWEESSGEGVIYSLTGINRVIMNSKDFNEEVPYTIASIELKEGVRMYGRILPSGDRKPSIGDSVISEPGTAEEGIGLPYFRLA